MMISDSYASNPSYALPEQQNAMSQFRRSVPLDFLRAIAILSVLLHHNIVPWQIAGPLRHFAYFFSRDGWLGVDLFFVLSGFLIGGLLFREIRRRGTLDAKRFLIRRGLKIWPAYYALLIFVALWSPVTPFEEKQPFYSAWLNWLHLQNYYHTPLGHTWSLAVEEHFYLALPLALLFILRFEKFPRERLTFFPWLVLAISVICLMLRFMTHKTGEYWFWIYGTPTHLRMDSLVFGVALAYIYHYHSSTWNKLSRSGIAWGLISLITLLPVLVLNRQSRFCLTWGFTLSYVGFGALLIACIGPQDANGIWRERLWSWHPIRWVASVGAFSYGIYLWHLNIARPIFHRLWVISSVTSWPGEVRWVSATASYVIFAVVSGILLSRLIEVPFLRWRERIYPPRDNGDPNPNSANPTLT